MSDPQVPAYPPPQPPQGPPVESPAPRPTRLRVPGIALIVLGAVALVLFILKVGIDVWTGPVLAVVGITLVAFSFIRLPRVTPDPEGPLPMVQKLAGVFYEPTRVFRNLRVYPHWVAAFVVVVALNVIYSQTFIQRVTPERIVTHTVEKIGEMGPPFAPPPEMLDTIRNQQLEQLKNPVQRVATVIKTTCGAFIWGSAISALSLLAVLAFGGRINFWQSLAVYFYAALPITVIQKVLSLVILFIKEPDDIHPILGQETLVQDNLGVLFSPAAHPVLFVIASFIGVLSFYGLWLRAKSLNQGGTRVSSGAAWGVAITLWVIGLVLITIVTALFPGFIA